MVLDNNNLLQPVELTKEEKRELRHKRCGTAYTKYDKYTGLMHRFIVTCGDYRYHEPCRKTRAAKEHDGFLNAIAEHDIVYRLDVLDSDWAAFVRKMQRSGIIWRRFPQSDGSSAVFLSSYVDGAEILQNSPPFELLLGDVPEDARITGKLWSVSKSKKKHENEVEITVSTVDTNAPIEGIVSANEQAVEETKDLDPKDAAQVEAALQIRTNAFCRVLARMGYTVKTTQHKEYCRDSGIQWIKDNSAKTIISREQLDPEESDET